MYNDVKHAAFVSIFVIGMAVTPNSSIASVQWSTCPRIEVQSTSTTTPAKNYDQSAYRDTASFNFFASDEASWVSKLYITSNADVGESLLLMFDKIDNLLQSGDMALCDYVLAKVDYAQLQPEIMVGLLRITSSFKRSLPSWKDGLEASRKILADQGLDSERILKGLKA